MLAFQLTLSPPSTLLVVCSVLAQPRNEGRGSAVQSVCARVGTRVRARTRGGGLSEIELGRVGGSSGFLRVEKALHKNDHYYFQVFLSKRYVCWVLFFSQTWVPGREGREDCG